MDTKLKKLTEKQKGWVLTGGWICLSVIFTFDIVYWSYAMDTYYGIYSEKTRKLFGITAITGSIIFLILFSLLVWKTPGFIKARFSRKDIVQRGFDKIKMELLILAFSYVAFFWSSLFSGLGRSNYVWRWYAVDSPNTFFKFLLTITLLAIIYFSCIILVMRRLILGTLKSTSFVCEEIRLYRERTSFEKKIRDRGRGKLILYGIGTGVMIFIAWNVSWALGYALFLVIVVLSFLLFLLYFKSCVSSKFIRESALLVSYIHTVAEGGKIERNSEIEDDSPFYDSICELENIESAMEKSIEKQMQAERMKIDLITNVSHDLKTPLTSMVGYTDLLKKEELSQSAADYVEVISIKQEQLKAMIQDLFELSKATSGSEQLKKETLDMKKLLEQTLGDMEDRVEAGNRTIRTSFTSESLLFTGDNGKMYRVVQNLLENALKYSLDGTRIYIEAGKEDGMIYMVMKNIASYEMDFAADEIMERFVRGDQARSTEGHGLGLAIASSFVRNMGGRLDVDIDGDLFKVTMRFPCAMSQEGDDR